MGIRHGLGLALPLVLLVVVVVHAQEHTDQQVPINIVHKPGYCAWYGECADTPTGGKYNCLYNGPAKRFADNRTMFDLMQATCPQYINQTHPNDSVACCDYTQLDTLVTQEQIAVSLFSRCPACLKNFYDHFCSTTCDPNQSLFLDYQNYTNRTFPSGMSVAFVKWVDVYITMEYTERLYNSCKNVEFPGEGSKVISLMCGEGDCNATKWLAYLGDPNANHGEAPFAMAYHFEPNTTVPGFPNMSARSQKDAKFYECNSSDPNVVCSCSDCPANNTCPPPPPIVIHHFPFKIVALAIGSVGGVIAVAIWMATLISGIIQFSKKSGYTPIGRTDNSQHGSMNDDENDSSTSSVGSVNDDRIEDVHEEGCGCQSCCRIGAVVENYIKKIFYHWGKFATEFWYIVLTFSVLFCAGLSIGLLFFNVTTDPVKLWSAPTSRARVEKGYFDTHFAPFYRTEQLIITAPNLTGFYYQPTGTFSNWSIGPVMQMEVLKEVFDLQENITNIVADYVDADGNKRNVTLSDICFKPLLPDNGNCTIQSVLNYFQNDYAKLTNATYGPFHVVTYNATFHLHDCTRNPTDTKGNNEEGSCMAAYGAPIDPNTVLGGFQMEPNGIDYDYDSAEALVVTFVVNNHVDDRMNKKAEAWEKAFLAFMADYTGEYIKVVHSAERALEDELKRESETDIFTILVSYLLMFAYITLFLGHVRSLATILVDMKIILGFFGVLLVLVAVTSSLGFFSYMGLTASLIVLEVVPFLVLAVGVDNLFILVHSYERQAKKFAKTYNGNLQQMPIKELIGRTVGEVAPSLLLTSLSETSAFLLGGISTMPAVRTFSFYAGIAVFFNFLLQITAFVSMMSLDARRQISNRFDVVCIKLKDKFDPRIGKDLVHGIMNFFAKTVLHLLVRPFILLFFCLTFTASLILLFRINIGLNQTVALPKDSYLLPYFSSLNEYLHVGPPVYFVIEEGYDYTTTENQNKICSGAGCDTASFGTQISVYARLPNYTRIAEPPLLWLDTYYQWISPNSDCCGINTTDHTLCHDPTNKSVPTCVPCLHRTGNESYRPNSTEFTEYLHWFLSDNPTTTCASGGHAAFAPAVQVENNTNKTHILATYAMTYHTILKDSPDYIDALKKARELGANLTKTLNITVFPYSIFYVYYEQYLTIVHAMGLNISASLGAVFFVSFLLLGLNLWAALMVVFIVSSIIVHMLGSMAILGINANAVSLVNLVMTVGISVEFCSHIIRWFVSCSAPTRRRRALSALANMGASVFSGITVTKFIGVFVLLFAKSQIFEVYYFRMYMCMLLWGALHGLVLLPVLLSFIGPPYCPVRVSPPYSDKFLQDQRPTQTQPPHTPHSEPPKPPREPQPKSTSANGTSQQYPAPTYRRQYPTLPNLGTYDVGGTGVQQRQYPAATHPREGSGGANEHTRLIDS